MNTLTHFNYQGQEIRTVQRDNETWFVLKDVCEVLELSNPTIVASRLDDDERAKFDLGRQGESNIINESGLYNVIIRSDKPQAKPFKRWVTHEVLPSIRRHGAYMTPDKLEQLMNDPDAWITLITALKQERSAKNKLAFEAEKNKPKVLFADAVAASGGTILIGELAKILKGNGVEIGQNRLFERLRQDGFLIKRQGSDYNAPTQRAMELGLFQVKETAITHADGHVTISKTTKVTGKGQQYFISLLMQDDSIKQAQ